MQLWTTQDQEQDGGLSRLHTSHCARGTLYSITHCCYHMTHLPGQCRRKQTDKNFVNRGSEPVSCKKIMLNQTTIKAPHLVRNQINTVQRPKKLNKTRQKTPDWAEMFFQMLQILEMLVWPCQSLQEFAKLVLWHIIQIPPIPVNYRQHWNIDQLWLSPVTIDSCEYHQSWQQVPETSTYVSPQPRPCVWHQSVTFTSSLVFFMNRKRDIVVEHKHKLSHTFPTTRESAASRCTTRKC